MIFQKIKASKEGKITIAYEVKKSQGYDEFYFSTFEKALPAFHEALQELKTDVQEICELPEDYKERIFVTGVSFSYGGENETMGATIIAQMHLKNSNVSLNLNTPHKASEPYGDGKADPKQLLDGDCLLRLDTLIEEAEKFIKGIRVQGDLFEVKIG